MMNAPSPTQPYCRSTSKYFSPRIDFVLSKWNNVPAVPKSGWQSIVLFIRYNALKDMFPNCAEYAVCANHCIELMDCVILKTYFNTGFIRVDGCEFLIRMQGFFWQRGEKFTEERSSVNIHYRIIRGKVEDDSSRLGS